jgi:hypothetical protein
MNSSLACAIALSFPHENQVKFTLRQMARLEIRWPVAAAGAPSALFEISTPPFSRMKRTRSVARFPFLREAAIVKEGLGQSFAQHDGARDPVGDERRLKTLSQLNLLGSHARFQHRTTPLRTLRANVSGPTAVG